MREQAQTNMNISYYQNQPLHTDSGGIGQMICFTVGESLCTISEMQ